MPRRDSARSKLSLGRTIAIVIAAGMGLAAVCLVVFGTTQKQLQIGVLLGLWGGLIAAFLVFGARRSQADQFERLAEAEQQVSQLHEAQLQVARLQREQADAAVRSGASQELELRRQGEVLLSREVAARREADLNLELSLRREIERMMNDHIGALRDEVAALRAEVVDKLGGELRLERIETTRLIGSDLEALQHEIRRLAGSQRSGSSVQVSVSGPLPNLPYGADEARAASVDRPTARAAPWRVEHASDIVDAEVIETGSSAAREGVKSTVMPSEAAFPTPPTEQPEKPVHPEKPAERPAATSAPPAKPVQQPAAAELQRAAEPAQPVTQPQPTVAAPQPAAAEPAAWSAPTVVNTDPLTGPGHGSTTAGDAPLPLYQQSEQVAAFTASFDPFAGLPRLSPLPDDLDLIVDTESETEPDIAPPTSEAAPAGVDQARREAGGRRRAPAEDDEPEPRYHGRRRAGAGEVEPGGSRPAVSAPVEPGSGRRRAPDDAPDDLLARITKS